MPGPAVRPPGERVGELPVDRRPGGKWCAVVHGRPQQRVAEPDPLRVHGDQAEFFGGGERFRGQAARDAGQDIAVGVTGGRDEQQGSSGDGGEAPKPGREPPPQRRHVLR
jgi:hypothetical protein